VGGGGVSGAGLVSVMGLKRLDLYISWRCTSPIALGILDKVTT